MKNSKLRRALLLVACAVMLVSVSVSATLAYLTSRTEVVNNTFSVGNVNITLDEAPVDTDGKETSGDRVMANSYKLLPGHDYDKDPTVHVAAGSEECYLFVKVVNGISAIEKAYVKTTTTENEDGTTSTNAETLGTIAKQMEDNGWVALTGIKDAQNNPVDTTNVYYLNVTKTAGEDAIVFENFAIKDDMSNTTLASYTSATITVQAYAVQKDGFDSAAEAYAAAPCTWTAAN